MEKVEEASVRYTSRKFWMAILLIVLSAVFMLVMEVAFIDWAKFGLILYGAYAGANVTQKVFFRSEEAPKT